MGGLREQPLPNGGSLEQGDATGWMGMFQLNVAIIAFELAMHDPHYEPMVHRFGQDLVIVAKVLQHGAAGTGLWNDGHGFFFDVVRYDSERVPLETLLSLVNRERLAAILQRVLDEEQFLSEYGVRSLSRAHGRHPYTFSLGGRQHEVSYQPGVSNNFVRDENGRSAVFGDNEFFQADPEWRDYVPFHEYFHGDTGERLGAGHQTGWTALVALQIQHGGRLSFENVRVDDTSTAEIQKGKVA